MHDDATGTRHPGPPSPPRGRILLVEDDVCIRGVAREILENLGFEVAEAVDGQDGLEQFSADPRGIDLVVLDLVMPRMHGYQVLDGIRALSPRTPILICSGYSAEARPEVMVPTATLGFLPKPYRAKDLQLHIGRLLAPAP